MKSVVKVKLPPRASTKIMLEGEGHKKCKSIQNVAAQRPMIWSSFVGNDEHKEEKPCTYPND
jgi:hypothetical protein